MKHRAAMLVRFATAILVLLAGVMVLGQESSPDPLPLRRVLIPAERVALEVQRARPGALVQLPRGEFEAKVRRTQQALEAAKAAPRLLKSSYAAELVGSALAGGSGQWSVAHQGPAPGVLRLPHFNLALSRIKLGNADAVLGDLDGKNLGLAIATAGAHEVLFDWSLRGQPQPDGLAFTLRLPPCPLSVLELRLPADHALVVDKAAGVLTGPLDSERPGTKIWRLQSTGRDEINLLIRKSGAAGGERLVFANLDTRQQVGASSVLADYDFHLEVVRGLVTELVFDGDEALEPYEVSARGVELLGWDSERQPKAGMTPGGVVVRVRMREPLQGAAPSVRVRCLARRGPDQEWRSPELRLRDAWPRGEMLQLHVTAPLQIERWDAGQFRLVHSSGDETGHQLRLVDRAAGASPAQRPRLWTPSSVAGLFAKEEVRWSIAPTGMTLAYEATCELRRGRLFELGLRLPAGPWIVDQVLLEPAERLRTWTMTGPILFLDLQRALDTGNPVKIAVRLRSVWNSAGPPPSVAIPELSLMEASTRQGTCEIHVDPALEAALAASSAPQTAQPAPAEAGPASFFFVYRDRPLAGSVRLLARRPALTAQVMEHVTLEGGGARATAYLDIEPVAGQADFVDLFMSGGRAVSWSAGLGNAGLRLERRAGLECLAPLLSLAARHPAELLPLRLWPPRGATWRLHFPDRLHERAAVVLRGELTPSPPPWLMAALPVVRPDVGLEPILVAACLLAEPAVLPRQWEVPIVTAPGVDHVQGKLIVHAQRELAANIATRALVRDGGERGPASSSQAFTFGASWPPPEASVSAFAGSEAAPLQRRLDLMHVTHYVGEAGRVHHHVQLHVAAWPDHQLPLRLPAGVKVLAARLDGRWLDQLNQVATENGVEIRLPVPQDGAAHWLEVLATTEAAWNAPGPLFAAAALTPSAPGVRLRTEHVWRLAPGLAPLAQERMRSLHPGLGSPVPWLRALWHSADPLTRAVTPLVDEPAFEPQRQLFLTAEAAVRRRLPRESHFAEAIERLLFEAIKEPVVLVLDREALDGAGLRGDTSLSVALAAAGRPFWEGFGLTLVPGGGGPVLATPGAWPVGLAGDELRAAAAQAARYGQDPSGRFCRADFWLRHQPATTRASSVWPGFLPGTVGTGWTEWAPMPGVDPGDALLVARFPQVRLLGIALAGALFAALALLGRSWRAPMVLRFLILALVAVGFGLFALPQSLSELAFWPLAAVAVHVAASWLRCVRQARSGQLERPPTSPPGPRPAVVAGLLVLLSAWHGGRPWAAQPDAGDWLTVFYVEAGERPTALVRPELLKRLDDLERQALAPGQGAVVVSVAYTGSMQAGVARFDAQLEIFNFAEQAALHVPLSGVELSEGALLDGAPAFPAAAAANGFVLPIAGRGLHRLSLAFSVRPQLVGDHLELRCGIPMVPQARLTWQAPPAHANPQLLKAAGETTLHEDPKTKGQELRAQLGRESSLHLRWRPSDAPAAAMHEVREAYWWNLDEHVGSFTGLLRYAPAQSPLAALEIALPESLEVRAVEIAGVGAGASGPRVSRWGVEAKPRRLMVELATPATAPFTLRVHGVPRVQLGSGHVSLRLPLPSGAKTVEGTLAYRLAGAEAADKAGNVGVTVLAPEVFAKSWRQAAGGGEAITPSRAYSFTRVGPAATLELALQPRRPTARLEAAWRLDAHGAELSAKLECAGEDDLALLEMQLPANLQLGRLDGPHVHHWSVAKDRLQVWLTEPRRQTTLELTGWLSAPLVQQRFALPRLDLLGGEQATTVRLAAAPGWPIEPAALQKLRGQPDAAGLVYEAETAAYSGAFALRPVPAQAEFDALTSVESRGDVLAVTTVIEGRVPHGTLPNFSVRWRNWEAPVRHEISLPAVEETRRRIGADQVWSFALPPGSARQVKVQLRSFVAGAQIVALPRLEVEGGALREHVVVVPAESVRVVKTQGLVEAAAPSKRLPVDLEAVRRQGGTVWRATGAWQALVQSGSRPASDRLRVLHAEQQAALADNLGWLHQAQYLLQVHDARYFHVTLPADAELVGVTIEGQAAEVLRSSGGDLAAPLAENQPLTRVLVQWRYPPDQEGLLRPRLEAPAVADGPQTPTHVLLFVPPGLAARELPATAAPGDARLLLGRYAAVVEAGKGDLAHVGWLDRAGLPRELRRHLDYLLRLGVAGDDAEDMRRRLEALDNELRGGDPKRSSARSPWDAGLGAPSASAGTPYSWRAEPGTTPQIVLERRSDAADAAAWARELFTLVLMSLFLISWVPGGISWFWRLWPELLAGLTLVGCFAWGWSAVGLGLLAAATVGRLWGLLQLPGLRRTPVTSPGGSSARRATGSTE